MDMEYLTASIAPEEQDEASDNSEDEKPTINETMLSQGSMHRNSCSQES